MDGYYKGRRVLEFRTLGDFIKGQNFIQHLLPQPWAGTGHVVYLGQSGNPTVGHLLGQDLLVQIPGVR